MKSPAEIGARLARQWQQGTLRAQRLLNSDAWPLTMPIGRPSASCFANDTASVKHHVQRWQEVDVGEVRWESINYRAGAEPVQIPTQWVLRSPSEWVVATGDTNIRDEFSRLEYLVERVDAGFRDLLVRQRALWHDKPDQVVVDAARLAMTLNPGSAAGKPLRLLGDLGVDTKFIEHYGALLTRLLDERFDGAASEQGLVAFLNAHEDHDHWLLVVPLEQCLLPFQRQRIPATELAVTALPAARVLIVENEHCLHLLPALPDTIAVLGAGQNLTWLQADWLLEKDIGYWGDMDSWGLMILAKARSYHPRLTALMMNQTLFEQYATRNAVLEPTIAGDFPPKDLIDSEKDFYRYLIGQELGRLEQEFLPAEVVHMELQAWIGNARE